MHINIQRKHLLAVLFVILFSLGIFYVFRISLENERYNQQIISRMKTFQSSDLLFLDQNGKTIPYIAEELINSLQNLYLPKYNHPKTIFTRELISNDMHGFSKVSLELILNGSQKIGVVAVYEKLKSGKEKYVNSYSSIELTSWIIEYMEVLSK